MYVYFGIREPDRLQSEDYRVKSRVLQITESKGGKFAVNPVELVDIANPYPETNALTYKASNPTAEPTEPPESRAAKGDGNG
jgi:hypothetical protein